DMTGFRNTIFSRYLYKVIAKRIWLFLLLTCRCPMCLYWLYACRTKNERIPKNAFPTARAAGQNKEAVLQREGHRLPLLLRQGDAFLRLLSGDPGGELFTGEGFGGRQFEAAANLRGQPDLCK